jgi:16S rRNA (guanine527-N7)-methyltransferase
MEIRELIDICNANGLILPDETADKLALFAKLLLGWNAKINLISRKDEAHILDAHILHSLVLRMPAICDYDLSNKRVFDLGTGGGLPGIPLKIVTPTVEMVLTDSIQKKITACSDMITELELKGINAICGRAEDIAKQKEFAHTYDAAVSRAVAPLADLAKWSKGMLKSGGILFALKGGNLDEEIAQARTLKFVKQIESKPLELAGYGEFAKQEKKLVAVQL